nr:hypothetical protein [Sodalis glossinidius]
MLYWLLTRLPDVSDELVDFADGVLRLTFFASLIAGLGRAFLSNHRPSWRLPAILDAIALAMKLPPLLATFVLISGAIEQLNSSVGTSVSTTHFRLWAFGAARGYRQNAADCVWRRGPDQR